MHDVWPIVHAERHALILDLEGISDAQWAQPSLCDGWTVHDVAAHLVDTALATRVGFAVGLVRARFDFHRLNEQGLRRERRSTPRETLGRLKEVAGRTSTPPAPLDSRLVEEIVHGEDIRRPLGLSRAYPQAAVVRALTLQSRTPAAFGGAKELMSAVSCVATDGDARVGAGPEVRGPALSLLLALTGRRVARTDLAGPGLPLLAENL